MCKKRNCQQKYGQLFVIFLVFSLFIILQTITISAVPDQWCSEAILTTSTNFLKCPCTAINNRIIHVVWLNEDMNTSELHYSKSTNNGNTWYEGKKLTENSSLIETPQIAVNGNIVHILWKDFRTGNPEIFYKKSEDNGETWIDDLQLTFNHTRSFDIYDLNLAVYQNTVHIIWKDYRSGSSEIYYKNSYTNGDSWELDQRLTHDYTPSYSPCIAVYQHTVYVTWDNWGEKTEIWLKKSEDNGKTWCDTKTISSDGAGTAKNSWVAVNKETVYVVWQKDFNGIWSICYSQSVNGGMTWSDEQRLRLDNDSSFSPKIVYVSDVLYLFWKEIKDNMYVFAESYSTDNGLNWSKKLLLTDNNISAYDMTIASSEHTQFFLWRCYTSGYNQICYRKKSEIHPIISAVSVENTKVDNQQNMLIIVNGGDASYENSVLICQLECKCSSGDYFPIETNFYENFWEGNFLLNGNYTDGEYLIRAKLVNPENKESSWYTTTARISFSDNPKDSTSGFEFFIVVISLVAVIGLYTYISKGGKNEDK